MMYPQFLNVSCVENPKLFPETLRAINSMARHRGTFLGEGVGGLLGDAMAQL